MSKIKVYNFRKYDIDSDQYINLLDKRKRTIEAIENLGEGYSKIPGTCIDVDQSEIDRNGRYPEK